MGNKYAFNVIPLIQLFKMVNHALNSKMDFYRNSIESFKYYLIL